MAINTPVQTINSLLGEEEDDEINRFFPNVIKESNASVYKVRCSTRMRDRRRVRRVQVLVRADSFTECDMNVPRPMAGSAKLIVGLTGDELADAGDDDDDEDEFVVSVEPLSMCGAGVAKGLNEGPEAAAAYM